MPTNHAMIEKKYKGFTYYEYQGKDQQLRDMLQADFPIRDEDLEDIFSSTQLSKVEERKDYLYFALQLPSFNQEYQYIQIKQIHCVVSPQYLFVIDESGYEGLDEVSNQRDDLIERDGYNSFDLFYEILDMSVIRMFRILYRIQRDIKATEELLFLWDTEEDQIRDIQTIKKNIVNFKSLIEPLHDLVEEMLESHGKYVDVSGEEDLDDSLDKLKKLDNKLGNFHDTMALLTETNELLIARSTNKTIKVLTIVNLFLFVPSVLAGFFGMNVYFGWHAETEDFTPLLIILLVIFSLTGLFFLVFKKKRWI